MASTYPKFHALQYLGSPVRPDFSCYIHLRILSNKEELDSQEDLHETHATRLSYFLIDDATKLPASSDLGMTVALQPS